MYGGSFDPPHLGHYNIVKTLKEKYPSATKILIIPNSISPFKAEKSLNSEEIRKLCQLTFFTLLDHIVEMEESEILNSGTSYTVDTISRLKDLYPEENLWLCIGEDSLPGLPDWYHFSELDKNLEGYVILRRKTRSPLPIHFQNLSIEYKSHVLENEIWEVSSSRLREERDIPYAKHWMVKEAFQYLENLGWFHPEL